MFEHLFNFAAISGQAPSTHYRLYSQFVYKVDNFFFKLWNRKHSIIKTHSVSATLIPETIVSPAHIHQNVLQGMFCNNFCACAIHWCIIALMSCFCWNQRSFLIWKKNSMHKTKMEVGMENVKNWHRLLHVPSERLMRSVTAAITDIRISMTSYTLNIKPVTYHL